MSIRRIKYILILIEILLNSTFLNLFSIFLIDGREYGEEHPQASNWDPYITRSVLENPYDVFVGDANNDGYNDILTDDVLLVWNNISKDWEIEYTFYFANSVCIGDANNDGYNDIVTNENADISILMGVPNGFDDTDWIYIEKTIFSVAIEDVNHDSYNDIVALCIDSDEIEIAIIMWNPNTEDWDEPILLDPLTLSGEFYFFFEPTGFFVGDWNNDGLNEILITIYVNDMGASIIISVFWEIDEWVGYTLFLSNLYVNSLYIADPNNDGENEVLFVNYYHNTITIYSWDGGSLTLEVGVLDSSEEEFDNLFSMDLISVGDVNNDGYNDIVTANYGEHTVSILLWNDSKGYWDIQIKKPVGMYPNSVMVADANNDGYTDIVTANFWDRIVSIILWDEPPIITINQPFEGEVFGKIAPEFNIEVDDPDIDSMWYILNGSEPQTFISNGTIDQILWNDIENGTVRIEFYANDTGSNVGHAEVTVRKDIIKPVILIHKPLPFQQFIQVPFFNISIDQTDIASMWYAINGGNNNYTFDETEGFIDEDAWDDSPSGFVRIDFYANDTLNNIGYNYVYVRKVLTDVRTISVEIIEQLFTIESFNMTFYISNATYVGIDNALIMMWWNGVNVSSDIYNQGNGMYFVALTPITVFPGKDPILLNMTISALGYEDKYFETHISVGPCEFVKYLQVEIIENFYSPEHFNFTFFIFNETGYGIEFATIQMWWNGGDVSAYVQDLGSGYYFVSLEPITVESSEDPIQLNMTISATGYVDKYFKTEITVLPCDIIEDILNLEIIAQGFSIEEFNFTFFVHNSTDYGIDWALIQIWWNGMNVSAGVQNLGNGFYFISLEPITVDSGGDPILLNITISALGFAEEYFETYVSVQPCDLIQDTLALEIVDQVFLLEEFNITIFIHNSTDVPIEEASIQIWWDGLDVSTDVINLGNGYYFISLEPITVDSGEDPILLNMTISAPGFAEEYFETYVSIQPCDLIQDTLALEIVDQVFSLEEFNITIFIHNSTGFPIDGASIQIWWDGLDVSTDVVNLGNGYYFISLNPIIVNPGETPILLKITISNNGFEDLNFETNIAVDPDTLQKENGGSTGEFPLPIIIISLSISVGAIMGLLSFWYLRRKRADKTN